MPKAKPYPPGTKVIYWWQKDGRRDYELQRGEVARDVGGITLQVLLDNGKIIRLARRVNVELADAYDNTLS